MAAKPLTAAAAIAAAGARPATPTPSAPTATKPSVSAQPVELEPEMPVESVRVDGLAIMKMIKHAREHAATGLASSASGQLLGLDSKGVLTVSDTIPLPSGSLASGGDGEDSRGTKAAARYTSAILPRLSALGSDANLVGFYMATTHGQHLATPGFLDALVTVQLGAPPAKAPKTKATVPPKPPAGGKGIALVYDLASAPQGVVNLKAFRLSAAFVDAHSQSKFDSQSLIDNKLTHTNILEEIPLNIQSTALLNAFLATLVAPQSTSPRITAPEHPYSRPVARTNLLSSGSTPSFVALGLPSAKDSEAPAPLSNTLTALLGSLDAHNAALSTLSFQSRQLARDRTRLEGLIAKRKADNEARAVQGLPPLPASAEEAALQEPSRLDTMCALSGVEGAAYALSQSSGTDIVRAYGAKAGAVAS